MLDPVRWIDDKNRVYDKFEDSPDIFSGKLRLIDQTLLPTELKYVTTDRPEEIFDFIKRLVVRGAPAIGCSAALGLAASAKHFDSPDKNTFFKELEKTASYLNSSRPTAVNLSWALKRCVESCRNSGLTSPAELQKHLLREALSILEEDIAMCKAIGTHGATLLKDGFGVLTHCNAGALATGDYGTALSPVYVAHEKGMNLKVYSDETRPLLQGSRLTAWELDRAGIDVTTICDNMAAQLMKEGKINIVIVGADRVAANGDAANKIGTYAVAILANYHKIPFYIAIPYSTMDHSLKNGSLIPIEQRHRDEVARGFGKITAPDTVKIYNPAFDVTPHELITGFITERGIFKKTSEAWK